VSLTKLGCSNLIYIRLATVMTLQPIREIESEIDIPVDMFISPNPNHPTVQGMFKPEAGKITFKAFVALMGYPSLRRLAKLLGCPDYVYVYRWNSGTFRPSQLYLGRMIYLIKLKFVDGIKLENINHINWTTGVSTNDYRNNKPTVRPNLQGFSIEQNKESQPMGIARLGQQEQSFIKPSAKPPVFGESTEIFQNN